ncbi:MAG: ornithine cyclodeaminase family protein [Acidobacteriia bacterium]|jgi:ornithine cyclodeaminase/alanine dehydrogenase-like protein (mu-crystallin family)|nr:ornithine cyclodeaminase family protein [Terriglobia bacterium]
MALLLSEADVRAVLTMPVALDAVEQAFRHLADGTALLHPRRRFALPEKVFLHYMAAADTETGYAGLKIYTSARGSVRFLVPLYRTRTGELVALLEADYLGQMRTGAASGIATKYMARADATTAGIIGTGLQARTQLEAIAAVRQLSSVRAYSRNPERRAQFAREMTERLQLPVYPAGSAEEAVREAEIVVTATNSSTPVLLGRWLAPGTHVNAIGANFPQKRELDEEAVRRAGIIAVDSREQAMLESGDLLAAFGGLEASAWMVVRELADIVAGRVPGRTDARQVTLFKSNGVAVEDVAVAARVVELAQERGLGTRLPLFEHCG